MVRPYQITLAFMALVLIASLGASNLNLPNAVGASLPVFVLSAQLFLVILLVISIFRSRSKALGAIYVMVAGDARILAFLVALTAMCGSLSYQFLLKLTPCDLCWFQRIFMYPLSFIIAISLLKKTENVHIYVMPLCVIGAFIAAYHYYIQVFSVFSFDLHLSRELQRDPRLCVRLHDDTADVIHGVRVDRHSPIHG